MTASRFSTPLRGSMPVKPIEQICRVSPVAGGALYSARARSENSPLMQQRYVMTLLRKASSLAGVGAAAAATGATAVSAAAAAFGVRFLAGNALTTGFLAGEAARALGVAALAGEATRFVGVAARALAGDLAGVVFFGGIAQPPLARCCARVFHLSASSNVVHGRVTAAWHIP